MPTALAIAAHPDDIELKMAGTLLQLRAVGWEIHYLNLANGHGGSLQHDGPTTAALRREEARAAAAVLGAVWHPPLTEDLAIFYEPGLLRKVAAVVREVQPSIVLTHPPQDYMEDHTATCRLAVTAAFAHGIVNYATDPPQPAYAGEVAVYHCMPHGGRSPLRQRLMPGAWVDTHPVLATQLQALAEHRSQQAWLDTTQGMNDYLQEMEAHAREMGRQSQHFSCAEGWWRHLHLGFSRQAADPLATALGPRYRRNPDFEDALDIPAPPSA